MSPEQPVVGPRNRRHSLGPDPAHDGADRIGHVGMFRNDHLRRQAAGDVQIIDGGRRAEPDDRQRETRRYLGDAAMARQGGLQQGMSAGTSRAKPLRFSPRATSSNRSALAVRTNVSEHLPADRLGIGRQVFAAAPALPGEQRRGLAGRIPVPGLVWAEDVRRIGRRESRDRNLAETDEPRESGRWRTDAETVECDRSEFSTASSSSRCTLNGAPTGPRARSGPRSGRRCPEARASPAAGQASCERAMRRHQRADRHDPARPENDESPSARQRAAIRSEAKVCIATASTKVERPATTKSRRSGRTAAGRP